MTRGEVVCSFIHTYCRVPEGAMVGQPLKLEPFQVEFIKAVYDNRDGTQKAYLSIARKNGKTALIACLVLAHLVGPEAVQNSQIASGAMSREQASILFGLVAKMVRLSTELSDVIRIVDSRKELYGLPMGTEFKALAAEAKTAHGKSLVLAILDEVGQVRGPKSEFIDAIVTSQGAHHNPLLIAISTQAADDNDLFSIWLDDAEKSGDPRIVSHLYAADKSAELDDPEAWKAANPALGVFRSLRDVEQQAAEAKRMPSAEATFRNLVLNQRVSIISPFMSKRVWDACNGEPTDLAGLECYGGLDLSARQDLTAFVLIGKRNGIWQQHAYFWSPAKSLLDRARRDRQPYDLWRDQGHLRTTPGMTVDYAVVARDIAEICEGLDIKGIAFDRWRIDQFKRELAEINIDLPLVEHGQGFKDMTPALDTMEAEYLNARVRHGNNPVMTSCAAGAAVTKDPSGNRKLDKAKATARIDGIVAAAMAYGLVSKTEKPQQPIHYRIYV